MPDINRVLMLSELFGVSTDYLLKDELDVYLAGVAGPLAEADCRVVGVVRRRNDVEDKLIAVPDGTFLSKNEMEQAVGFQEQWYDHTIITLEEKDRFEELYEG